MLQFTAQKASKHRNQGRFVSFPEKKILKEKAKAIIFYKRHREKSNMGKLNSAYPVHSKLIIYTESTSPVADLVKGHYLGESGKRL